MRFRFMEVFLISKERESGPEQRKADNPAKVFLMNSLKLNALKKTVISSSLLLCLLMALSAASLAVAPGDSRQKPLVAGTILIVTLVPAIVGVFLIRALRALGVRAERLATRDSLTNLYNQKTFWDLLGYEIARSMRYQYRFSLVIADMDNFKVINDLYGHEAGDACLREFSGLFKMSMRKGDIAARYGGDQFAAILPICDEIQAQVVAKRFLDVLRGHSFLLPGGTALQITASIGIAVYPDHATNVENLFLVADTTLHQAKIAGKDRIRLPSDAVSIESLKSAGESYLIIMDALRKKQITPYFQPIVATKEDSVLAYEVLTRIVTPDTVRSAAEFIEAAEDMGAIGKIDYQLIEQAFSAVKGSGYGGMLFFNLSPRALIINEFMPTMRGLMQLYAIDPAQLVFEITERDTVKNLSLIERTIHELRRDGFKFAIDDFGQGYSSFQYVKMFKVDFLKIDGDFILNMNSDSRIEGTIVKNIVDLAAILGVKTIAEYVESQALFEYVRAAGIDFAQGYHIQRPSPELKFPPRSMHGGSAQPPLVRPPHGAVQDPPMTVPFLT